MQNFSDIELVSDCNVEQDHQAHETWTVTAISGCRSEIRRRYLPDQYESQVIECILFYWQLGQEMGRPCLAELSTIP